MIASFAALALFAAVPVSDAGPVDDADVAALDAGLADLDGGSIDLDGGSTDLDGGSIDLDAGLPALDLGFPAVDAGFAPPPELPAPSPPLDFTAASNIRVYGEFRSKLAIDTNFESRPGEPLAENVAELQSRIALGAAADFGDRARVVAEVRYWHRAVEQRPPTGETFWLFNGANAKATGEFTPGEAYLDLYSTWVDLRFGSQLMAFGANATGSPADVLNPIDLREGVFFADDPTDVKIPVLAARAQGELRGFNWMVAYVPFFVPDSYDLIGQDEALIQPALGAAVPAVPLLTLAQQDRAQQPLIETDRPKDLPQYGDLGLRVTRKLANFTVGADYVITREKLPEIIVDPELARFLSEGPGANFSDPATSLSLSQRLGAGEQLLHGEFPRYAVGELEGSALLGPVQVDLDVAHSASRLYVDSHLSPVFHPTSTGVLSVADARGTPLTLVASVTLLWIHDIPQGETLELLDLPGAGATAHQTVGGVAALLTAYQFLQDRFQAEGRFYLDPRQGSYAVGGRGIWNASDHVHLAVGYQRFSGPELSIFGYYRRNDAAWGEIALDL